MSIRPPRPRHRAGAFFIPSGVRFMSSKQTRRGPAAPPRAGPVRPGTPLYRLLQMIARVIAADRSTDRSLAEPDEALMGKGPPRR